jgi:hypothetical protein
MAFLGYRAELDYRELAARIPEMGSVIESSCMARDK